MSPNRLWAWSFRNWGDKQVKRVFIHSFIRLWDSFLPSLTCLVLYYTESVGYVIPSEIIQHFLTDVDAGRSPQFCHYGFDYQKAGQCATCIPCNCSLSRPSSCIPSLNLTHPLTADNDSLRRWAKLTKAQTGILVTRV